MLHFFHHPHSPYSQKVFFLLEEAGRPYDLRTVALEKRENRGAAYLEINPSGRVPAIKDGHFTLAESNAILRYLTRKHNLYQVYPVGIEEQAVVDMWWEFCSGHINRPLMDLAWHKILIHKYGGRPDMSVVEKAQKNLERDLPVLDAHLVGRNFLAGHELSLADINLMPFAAHARHVVPIDKFPAFKAWIQRVSERQAWRNVVAYSG